MPSNPLPKRDDGYNPMAAVMDWIHKHETEAASSGRQPHDFGRRNRRVPVKAAEGGGYYAECDTCRRTVLAMGGGVTGTATDGTRCA